MNRPKRTKFRSVNSIDLAGAALRFNDDAGGGGTGGGAPAPVPTPPPAPPANDGKPADGDGGEGQRTFDQAEVSRIAAREKEQGRRAAEQALADQLGMPIAEAKAILDRQRETEEAAKTDAQREKDRAAAERQAAENEKAAAKLETHNARVERAFLREGIDLDTLKDEERARIARLVSVEPGATFDEVLSDVKSVKAGFPGLFAGTAGNGLPGSDPSGRAPAPKPGEDAFSRGVERAKGSRGRFTAVVENAVKK